MMATTYGANPNTAIGDSVVHIRYSRSCCGCPMADDEVRFMQAARSPFKTWLSVNTWVTKLSRHLRLITSFLQ